MGQVVSAWLTHDKLFDIIPHRDTIAGYVTVCTQAEASIRKYRIVHRLSAQLYERSGFVKIEGDLMCVFALEERTGLGPHLTIGQ